MELLLCPWESPTYLFFSSNIPTLFFYSHIPAIIVALLAGFVVFLKSGKSKAGITLFIVTILFSLWTFFDLILWATNRPDVVMFFWSLQILLEPFKYNLLGVDLAYCTAIEGIIAQYFTYALEAALILLILGLAIYGYRKVEPSRKKEIVIFGL